MSPEDLNRRAAFSPCGRYRYSLWRELSMFDSRMVLFIGLNPSTADAWVDDPTVRREVDFARRLGFGLYCQANLFAWRATDPKKMLAAEDPVGPDNDDWLRMLAERADTVILAWGTHGDHQGRARHVLSLLSGIQTWCLGCNQDGSPCHPLYLSATRTLQVYPAAMSRVA